MIATPISRSEGLSGRGKLVLEEGMAAGVVDASKTPFKEEMAQAKLKSAGEDGRPRRRGHEGPRRPNRQGCTNQRTTCSTATANMRRRPTSIAPRSRSRAPMPG